MIDFVLHGLGYMLVQVFRIRAVWWGSAGLLAVVAISQSSMGCAVAALIFVVLRLAFDWLGRHARASLVAPPSRGPRPADGSSGPDDGGGQASPSQPPRAREPH